MPYRLESRSLAHASRHSRRRSRVQSISIGTVSFLFAAGAVCALCFLHLWQTTRIDELTAATQSATEHLEEVRGVNRVLEFRIEQAFSLERVARIARSRLGMIEPDVVHYVPLPADTAD